MNPTRARELDVTSDLRRLLRETLQIGDRAQSLQHRSPLLGSVPELDSLAVVSVITAIEEQFGIKVEDDEIRAETFETFGSLCDFVTGKLSAGSS